MENSEVKNSQAIADYDFESARLQTLLNELEAKIKRLRPPNDMLNYGHVGSLVRYSHVLSQLVYDK